MRAMNYFFGIIGLMVVFPWSPVCQGIIHDAGFQVFGVLCAAVVIGCLVCLFLTFAKPRRWAFADGVGVALLVLTLLTFLVSMPLLVAGARMMSRD